MNVLKFYVLKSLPKSGMSLYMQTEWKALDPEEDLVSPLRAGGPHRWPSYFGVTITKYKSEIIKLWKCTCGLPSQATVLMVKGKWEVGSFSGLHRSCMHLAWGVGCKRTSSLTSWLCSSLFSWLMSSAKVSNVAIHCSNSSYGEYMDSFAQHLLLQLLVT